MISTMVNKKNDEIDIITEKWNIDKEVGPFYTRISSSIISASVLLVYM